MRQEPYDVIVAGLGAGGAAAAIRAADLGARVLLLEKQTEGQHIPTTALSGGQIMSFADPKLGAVYLDRCATGMVPVEISRVWAHRAHGLVEWLTSVMPDVGLKRIESGQTHFDAALSPDFEGAGAVTLWWGAADPDNSRGRTLMRRLLEAIGRRPGVTVRWGSEVRRLVRSANGRVTGVEYRADGATHEALAARGVILATGGYGASEQLRREYLPAHPMHFASSRASTGDGIRIAQAVGADLWHMNEWHPREVLHFEADGLDFNFQMNIEPQGIHERLPGYLVLDRHGSRFSDEHRRYNQLHSRWPELIAYDADRREYSRIPSYVVFDEARRASGPIVGGREYYDWSSDNRREIASGWIKSADSIEELAGLLGITDPARAAEEVAEYNRSCETGRDRFGRSRESLTPLRPPFYGVPIYPGGPFTKGGPRRDEWSRVLDVFGQVIPGLCAAGELGHPMGHLYPSGGASLSSCLCFGQIAAEALVARD